MVANVSPDLKNAKPAKKAPVMVDVTQFIPASHARRMNAKASAAAKQAQAQAQSKVDSKVPAKVDPKKTPRTTTDSKVDPRKTPRATTESKADPKKKPTVTADSKVDPKGEAKGGSEVSKLKHQLRNLKKMNDFLSKKLDKMSKGHKELNNEHKSLKDSLRRMTVAEGQLAEELLAKVREKDMLRASLQKVMIEKEELELMVHSFGMKINEGSTSHHDMDGASDSEESAASDIRFGKSFESRRKFHESFHSDVIFHDSSYSDIEVFESFQSDMDAEVQADGKEGVSGQSDMQPNHNENSVVETEVKPVLRHTRSYSEAQFRVEFGGEDLKLETARSFDDTTPAFEQLKKRFKGRGTIRFYSVLEELFR